MYAILSKVPEHPSKRSKAVPKRVGDAIMRGLSKKKDDRYPDALAFKEALFGIHASTEKDREAYREVLAQALKDGVIVEAEQEMLDRMRSMLNITDEEHEEIFENVRAEMEESRGSTSSEMTVEIRKEDIKKMKK